MISAQHNLSRLVAANARRMKDRLGIPEKEFGRRSGMSAKTFNNILNANHKPTLSTLEKLATGFRVELWELLKPVGAKGTTMHKGVAASPAVAEQIERICSLLSELDPVMLGKFEGYVEALAALQESPEQ